MQIIKLGAATKDYIVLTVSGAQVQQHFATLHQKAGNAARQKVNGRQAKLCSSMKWKGLFKDSFVCNQLAFQNTTNSAYNEPSSCYKQYFENHRADFIFTNTSVYWTYVQSFAESRCLSYATFLLSNFRLVVSNPETNHVNPQPDNTALLLL